MFVLGNLRSDVNEIELRFTPAWDKINGMDQESDVNIGNDEQTNCKPSWLQAEQGSGLVGSTSISLQTVQILQVFKHFPAFYQLESAIPAVGVCLRS